VQIFVFLRQGTIQVFSAAWWVNVKVTSGRISVLTAKFEIPRKPDSRASLHLTASLTKISSLAFLLLASWL
jgi:hypothetical protein